MQLQSTITCPQCRHQTTETMPTDACQYFYECKGCGVLLKPRAGDCCVFCSYGSIPCPPIQEALAGKESGGSCCGNTTL
ncbi:MAG: GDCCVxC domain-containing (seleno)protein [Methylocystis sp.]|uniref:GDCCVxC domain-containing (seleno)protein n=1 Tax=Methylocystis sp. TaxID=1911079 RepID=UPI003D0F515F